MASAADGRELLSGAGLSIDGNSGSSPVPKPGAAASTPCSGLAASAGPASSSGGASSNGGAASPNPASSAAAVGKKSSHDLRLAADRAMIACVREDGGHHSYFSRPPLRSFTLCFEDAAVERDYRRWGSAISG